MSRSGFSDRELRFGASPVTYLRGHSKKERNECTCQMQTHCDPSVHECMNMAYYRNVNHLCIFYVY